MINVNRITAQLARMPDLALRQYAQMRKSDPYVLSLALAESNRRKRMRSSSQMSAPEQPKVVDQALAGMGAGLPALPANNLRGMEQSMAAGGIVAFDEGGEVPRFQSQGLVDERLYRSQDGQYFARPLTGKTGYEGMSPSEFLKSLYEDVKRKIGPGLSPPEKAKAERAAQAQANKLAAVQGSTYEELYGAPTAPTTTDPRARGVRTDAMPPGSAVSEPSAMPKGAAGTGLQTQRSSEPGLKLPQQQDGLPGLTQTATGTAQELQNMRGAFADEVPFGQQQAIGKYRAAREGAAQEGLARLKEDITAQGPGMVEAEQRAKAKETRLSKLESQAGPMALFQAGLAIMSGESPQAFTNIGRGGLSGLKAYSDNLDKLEASRDKLDETFSKIETFRQNRADMNKREIRAAENDIRSAAVEAEKLGLEALTKNTDANRADARSAFQVLAQNREAMYRVASSEKVGLAQVAATKEQAAATRAASESSRMATLAENVRKNIAAEALKKFPYDQAAQAQYEQQAMQAALRSNPALAQYLGTPGGGGAPSAGKPDFRLNEKTGKLEPVR